MTAPARPRRSRATGPAGRTRRAAVAFAAAAALAGCSAYETVTGIVSSSPVLACPQHRVVADAAERVRFRDGPGRDLTDVDFEGKIVDVRLACLSDVDKKTREGSQDVEVTLFIEARRGPANRDRKASFPYFLSVVGPDRRILYREAFTVDVEFPGNKTFVRFRNQPVTLELPINTRWTNRSYTIFTGFKLGEEELRFNRARREQQR